MNRIRRVWTRPASTSRIWRRPDATPKLLSTAAGNPAQPNCAHSDLIPFALSLDFQPDPKQAELLNLHHRRIVVNCTRQWGKTTVVSLKAVHHAVAHPGSLVLVASPGLRQSGHFLETASAFLHRLEIPTRPVRHHAISLKLPNGSRLIGLPEMPKKIRGFAADLLVIDEAAWVADEMIFALRPTLAATNGAFWMLSTPGPATGAFYDAWHSETGLWRRISVPATECPRITSEFLDEAREALGDRVFRREFMCEFSDDDLAVFPAELIRNAFDPSVQPLFPQGGRS